MEKKLTNRVAVVTGAAQVSAWALPSALLPKVRRYS